MKQSLGLVKTDKPPLFQDFFTISKIAEPVLRHKNDYAYKVLVSRGDYYFVWSRYNPRKKNTVVVTKLDPVAGKETELGAITGYSSSNAVVGDNGECYVQTFNDALLLFKRNSPVKVYTEKNGLPSSRITALAWYDGQLFIGHENGFSTFSPKTGLFKTVFTARRVQKKSNPLNTGIPYSIKAIEPDVKRACLWLGIQGDGSDNKNKKCQGIWRFTPKKHTLKRVFKEHGVDGLRLENKTIMFKICHTGEIYVLDPDRRTFKVLVAYNNKKAPFVPFFNDWPCVRVGNLLLLSKCDALIKYKGKTRRIIGHPRNMNGSWLNFLRTRKNDWIIATSKGQVWSIKSKQHIEQ